MPIITNSPDIGYLEVKVTLDISGTSPVINLVNQTTGNPDVSPIPPLDDLVWVLNIYSPTGTPIYTSDFDNPFQTGVWTTASITNAWPMPFGAIEWSEYTIDFQVKDSNDTIYPLNKTGNICRPVGNTKNSGNPYGQVDLGIQVMCERASIYIKDNTSKTYQGFTGTNISSYLAVDYPRDATGVRPDPFVITSFNTDALVPFTFNGKNYEATYYSIYEYDLGNNVFVRIRYIAQRTFPIQCNINLCGISCELKALEATIENGTCTDAVEAQQKVNRITPKLLRAFIAQRYPACGEDLQALADEIIAIGNFKCDCSGSSTGIGESAIVDGLLFDIVSEGGDIQGHFEVTGGNVVLYLSDKSYTFGECSDSDSEAITLVSKQTGTNVATCIKVDIDLLAQELYTATGANSALLNQLNALIFPDITDFTLVVDGGCIFDSTVACNYTFDLAGIPATTTFALITGLISGSPKGISFAFNGTNLPALQTYLNSLGFGTYVVTNLGSGNVQITSASNTNSLDIVYRVASVSYIADLSKDCTGYLPLSANEVVQKIINAFCDLDDTQLKTSQAYTIPYISPTSNTGETEVIPEGSTLNDFLVEFLDKTTETVNYILGLSKLNCTNIQNLFPSSILNMQSNDFVFGTKGSGFCNRIYPAELGKAILQYGIYDVTFRSLFCNLVSSCTTGQTCSPFSVFSVNTVFHSPDDNLMDLVVTYANTGAGVGSVSIRYERVDVPNIPARYVNPFIGGSPYTIPNVDEGQYEIAIQPIYADGRLCPYVPITTAACLGISAFTANVTGDEEKIIHVVYTASSPKVQLIINYPNGGQSTAIYTSGTTIEFTTPVNVYGVYGVQLVPICNETTGWIGQPTAPVFLDVPHPSNSSVINNTSGTVDGVTVSAPNIALNAQLGGIVGSGGVNAFYAQDGLAGDVLMYFNTGTIVTATLVTGTGSYPGVIGSNVVTFSAVTVSSGMNITLA